MLILGALNVLPNHHPLSPHSLRATTQLSSALSERIENHPFAPPSNHHPLSPHVVQKRFPENVKKITKQLLLSNFFHIFNRLTAEGVRGTIFQRIFRHS